MPAERAGLRPYDRITAVNGEAVPDGMWLVNKIHSSAGKTLVLTYTRGGVAHTVSVVPEKKSDPTNASKQIGLIGFMPQSEYKRVGVVEAATNAVQEFDALFTQTLTGLGSLVTQPSTALGKVSGPIGMARASGEVQDMGAAPYLTLAAMLSIALGIFNLLPIPALDGGRAIFILFEMVRGKPVDPEKEALVHVGGFALIISLMLVVAYHDIGNILAGKSAI
jgi:regulator of sigma E protease